MYIYIYLSLPIHAIIEAKQRLKSNFHVPDLWNVTAKGCHSKGMSKERSKERDVKAKGCQSKGMPKIRDAKAKG